MDDRRIPKISDYDFDHLPDKLFKKWYLLPTAGTSYKFLPVYASERRIGEYLPEHISRIETMGAYEMITVPSFTITRDTEPFSSQSARVVWAFMGFRRREKNVEMLSNAFRFISTDVNPPETVFVMPSHELQEISREDVCNAWERVYQEVGFGLEFLIDTQEYARLMITGDKKS